ncbi:MAG TPA: hypothetical protein VF623_05815 [Segetibacter sp.]
MKKIIFASLLVSLVACGGKNESSSSDRSTGAGNSAGSDVIAVDTMRMDTSLRSISPK